ncbi:hypothetical protein C7N43_38525 [Sphingobacteriales bacterium UPWRP_1]|nr:hypothetical protein C7N43_38525 [Sphingobacteriales bacterium UPWRP_1]
MRLLKLGRFFTAMIYTLPIQQNKKRFCEELLVKTAHFKAFKPRNFMYANFKILWLYVYCR